MNLNKSDWFYYGQWEQPPFSGSYWVHWYNESVIKNLGLKPLDGRILMFNGHTIVNKGDLDYLKSFLLNSLNNPSFFKNLLDESLKILQSHLDLADGFNDADFSFKKFVNSSFDVMVPWFLGVVFSDYMGDILKNKAVELGFDPVDVFASISQKRSLMVDQFYDALDIKQSLVSHDLLDLLGSDFPAALIKIKQVPELWSRIQSHVSCNDWIGFHHFWGDTLSLDSFLKELSALKQPILEAKISLPDELSVLCNLSSDLAFLRQYSAEVFDLVSFRAKPFLTSIADSFCLSYDDLLFLTPGEIDHMISNNTHPDFDVIKIRKNGFCVLKSDDKEKVIVDNEDLSKIKNLLFPKKSSLDEFSGDIASKGFAKGPAKVFFVPENMGKMQLGDVLVTTMTTPDFVPLMQKACAVVTDIGGLLSHAAIISREMKIPCIVGTKVATKSLKDGDLIEVDAIKGLVKKL